MIIGVIIKVAAVSFLLTTFFLTSVKADIFKYEGDDGTIHFTNVPTDSKYELYIKESPKKEETKVVAPLYSLKRRYDKVIKEISKKYEIDIALVKAIIKAESDFNEKAISIKGARGLMQLMPDTARRAMVKNAYDPKDNIEGGIRYLKYLMEIFKGNLPLVIAAYNAGENAVLKYGTIPPYKETQTFVNRVIRYHKIFKNPL